MKILPVESIREADKYTIANEPIASVDLMERAAKQCLQWFNDNFDIFTELTFICGLGNNGGDGLAIARMWHQMGSKSKVIIINHSLKQTEDFEINLKRLKEINVPIFTINSVTEIPEINETEIIVDSILGSGLNNSCQGLIAEVISYINNLKNTKISIDIPSGLFADKTNEAENIIVKADTTLSFELPKLAFLFPQNHQYVGNWIILPIQLSRIFIEQSACNNYIITKALVKKLYKPRNTFAHKGNFGHALIVSGSKGKMGATVLSAKACLKTGVGLLTVHCPETGLDILQSALPETMVEVDISENAISCVHDIDKYNAIGIGPGIGTQNITQDALKELLQKSIIPLVIDADAINIISENKTWMQLIPENSILTPHVKEFERITQKASNDFERNKLQIEFSVKFKVFVVLKGAHTCITTPSGECYFNITGNPGMATAGSGDVLTGIITSLLAQKYSSFEASVMGVYLHGLAGDIYKRKKAEETLIASDLIKNLGYAITEIKL